MLTKTSLVLLLGLICWSCLWGCAVDLVTGKKSYNWFSVDADVKLGSEVMEKQLKALHQKKKSVDEAFDPKMTRRVREVVRRIARVSHYPSFPYEAHVADLDIVNAWCAPGGKVMVYRGLYDPKKGLVTADSDDEMAAVLGHEIAHATARHVTESVSRQYTFAVFGEIALSAIAASGTGNAQDMFQELVVKGLNLYLPAYSRSNESEADRIGLFYTAQAGYNPRAAVDLWYRACKKKGEPFDLYASHPSSCSRARDLEALLPIAEREFEKLKKQ